MIKTILVFVLSSYLVKACKFTQKFSDCTANQMIVKISPINCTDSKPIIISGLACDFSCVPNTHLYYDTLAKELRCVPCPTNTYNLGGGIEYTSWNTLRSFSSNCWTSSSGSWELNLNCTPWHSSSDTFLTSGSSESNIWYETDLVFYERLVKLGSLEVIYRKDSPHDNSGDFFIYINDVIEYNDYSKAEFNWKTAKIQLNEGLKKIQMGFNKYSTNQVNELIIQTIRVTGVRLADLDCIDCRFGTFNSEHFCIECEDGSYLENGVCEECPDGTKADPGAKSIEDCKGVRKCAEDDYHFYYSDCNEGVQSKFFVWNSPLFCDNSNLTLPAAQEFECLLCGPGKYRENGKCVYCKPGFYTESGISDCKECSAGKYAPKTEYLSTWTSFPEGFESVCFSGAQHTCKNDWELRGDYITTSPVYQNNSKIVLRKKVKSVESTSSILFEFVIQGPKSILAFSINGINVLNITGNISNTQTFDLPIGDNQLVWEFIHSNEKDEKCLIKRIVIYGVYYGGGDRCIECKKGTYSTGSADVCLNCLYEYKENSLKTGCERCDVNFYSANQGECEMCVSGLVVSENGRSCVVSKKVDVEGFSFEIEGLSGSKGKASEYCDKQAVSCYKTFYGPVNADSHYFYISVLNPSEVNMIGLPQLSDKISYAFANLNTNKINLKDLQIRKNNENCLSNSSYLLVSLGTKVSNLSKSLSPDESLIIKYTNGDICQKNITFSSEIHFKCDKSHNPGWPVFTNYENCNFEFSWSSMLACPVCQQSEKLNHTEDCSKGKRKKYVFAGKNCVNEGYTPFEVTEEDCQEESVYKTWPFLTSLIVLGVLLFTLVLMCIFTLKTRKGYKLLQQHNMTSEMSERVNSN